MDAVEIQPVTGPFDAVVQLPGSKSYTNRALLVAALAEGESTITDALASDDTHYMLEALRSLELGWPAADFDVETERRRLADEAPIA